MEHESRPDVLLGKHAIIDLSGCNAKVVKDPSLIQEILLEAAQVAKLKVVDHMDYHFQPEGYTTILLLEESHLSIHTWPEYNYVSIDLYSCNLHTNFQGLKTFLTERFQAQTTTFTLLERGISAAGFPELEMQSSPKNLCMRTGNSIEE